MAGKERFLLLYGSQTGQAEAIAGKIRDLATERGLLPDMYCISQSEKKFDITKEPVVVVVVSTTGEGEPPETVGKFWRKLKKKTVPKTHLSGLHYGLLGLGDTNYTNFCNMGKMLHRRFRELGAAPFVDPGWADDGVGLEIVVEPWIEGLWSPLEQILEEVHTGRTLSPPPSTSVPSDQQPQSRKIPSTTDPPPSSLPPSSSVDFVLPSSISSPPGDTATLETKAVKPKPVSKGGRKDDDRGGGGGKTLSVESLAVSLAEFEKKLKGSRETPRNGPLLLPPVPTSFVCVRCEEPSAGVPDFPYHKVEYNYGHTGSVFMATIISCRQLTKKGALQKTIEVEMCVEDSSFSYVPGDAFSFICPNPSNEVDILLHRLGLTSCADHLMHLSVLPGTKKRNPVLPHHIPSPCSVRHYFTHCADFRATPKKALLMYLSSCSSDEIEKKRLQEFCNKSNTEDYRKLILGGHADLLDILLSFPSCQPSLDRLVELLPKLKPRFYSVASSPLTSPGCLHVTFNISQLPHRQWWLEREGKSGRSREGVASGWFNRATQYLRESRIQVPLVPRSVNPFHPPSDSAHPLIMIGPGTGVAPFIGFLEHRRNQHRNGTAVGRAWLFFGCRHPDTDHIYKSELEGFVSDGMLTKLTVCFSRLEEHRCSEGEGRYVQDGMRRHSQELAQWVMEDEAAVYICGDAENMAVDVQAAWVSILSEYLTKIKAKLKGEEALEEMKDNHRYHVDTWTS